MNDRIVALIDMDQGSTHGRPLEFKKRPALGTVKTLTVC